jgi:AcrR family transcriptional regulator
MLFSDRGFEATTTRDISAMAGLSPAAMYVHFSSKEELLFRLVCRAHERALAQVLDAVAPFTDPIDRVRALVRDFSMLHATNFRKARIAQYESRHLRAEHREAVAQTRLRIRVAAMREVRRGIDEGVFLIPDPRVAVLAIMSLAIDICRWYDPDGEFTPANSARARLLTSDRIRHTQGIRPHPRQARRQLIERQGFPFAHRSDEIAVRRPADHGRERLGREHRIQYRIREAAILQVRDRSGVASEEDVVATAFEFPEFGVDVRHLLQHRQQPRVSPAGVQIRADARLDDRVYIAFDGHSTHAGVEQVILGHLDDGGKNLFLVGEIRVEGARREPSLPGDVDESGIEIALPLEHNPRGGNQPIPSTDSSCGNGRLSEEGGVRHRGRTFVSSFWKNSPTIRLLHTRVLLESGLSFK